MCILLLSVEVFQNLSMTWMLSIHRMLTFSVEVCQNLHILCRSVSKPLKHMLRQCSQAHGEYLMPCASSLSAVSTAMFRFSCSYLVIELP